MALVDLDNFIESLMWMWNSPETATFFNDLKLALDKQGLAYKDGKIIKTQRRISAEAKENGYGESEDEKIRTALIHFFSNSENTSFEYWEGIPKKEVLTWLEQQKSK
jgi:hypothetical protein